MVVNPPNRNHHTYQSGNTNPLQARVKNNVSPTYSRESDAARSGIKADGADRAYLTIANALGNKTTPTIDLLRVGFLF